MASSSWGSSDAVMDRPRSVSLIDGGWVEEVRDGHVPDPRSNLQDLADRLVPKDYWRLARSILPTPRLPSRGQTLRGGM